MKISKFNRSLSELLNISIDKRYNLYNIFTNNYLTNFKSTMGCEYYDGYEYGTIFDYDDRAYIDFSSEMFYRNYYSEDFNIRVIHAEEHASAKLSDILKCKR